MEDMPRKQPLRRSTRLLEKKIITPKHCYIEHIYMLHSVTADLLPMANDLNKETLRNIITNYENIIGGLLTDNALNVQRI